MCVCVCVCVLNNTRLKNGLEKHPKSWLANVMVSQKLASLFYKTCNEITLKPNLTRPKSLCMDPETGCGLPLTGEKARLLIGTAFWFWNSIGPILAAAAKGNSMNMAGQDRGGVVVYLTSRRVMVWISSVIFLQLSRNCAPDPGLKQSLVWLY